MVVVVIGVVAVLLAFALVLVIALLVLVPMLRREVLLVLFPILTRRTVLVGSVRRPMGGRRAVAEVGHIGDDDYLAIIRASIQRFGDLEL